MGRQWVVVGVFCLVVDLGFIGKALSPDWVRAPGDALATLAPFHANREVADIHNRQLSDWVLQFHPWHHHVRESYLDGRLPLWNDMSGGGQPFAANMQCEAFSPYLPLLLIGGDNFADLKQLAQLLLAQLGCLLLAARFGLSPLAGCIVALCLSLSSVQQAFALHPHSGVSAWLPLLAWTLLRLRERISLRRTASSALLTGLMILSGHPETAFTAFLAATLVAICHVVVAKSGLRSLAAFLGMTGIVGALGTLVACVQVLPFAEYLSWSFVDELRSVSSHDMTLPATYMMTLIDPHALGTPWAHRPFQGAWNFIEVAFSIGAVSIYFVLVALVNAFKWRRAARGARRSHGWRP
ncbi:MAG: hypothetical protein KDB53_01340, partial [Planctomycetes bacterium]|nr:hypothetical protein [Planctomycetota bacterium]